MRDRHALLARIAPTAFAAVAALAAAEWVAWLHAGPGGAVAVAPAAGVALAAALLLPPRRVPGPLVAVTLAVAGVAWCHDMSAGTAIGLGVAAVAGAIAAALLLRWYASGGFRLLGVRDLFALVAAALVGGAVAGALAAAALAFSSGHGELWRAAYRYGLADALGMVLVACAAVTGPASPTLRRRGGAAEAAILGAAVLASSVFAIARWGDPLAYASVLLLVWAALRFGTRGVACCGIVMVAAADWAVARGIGPFSGAIQSADGAVLVVQAFLAVTLLAMLGLATALAERDAADAQRWIAAERSRRTFDHAPLGMAVTTLEGRFVELNRALCSMLGYAEADLVGRSLRSLRAADTGEHELPRAWPTGPETTDRREQRLVRADGETVWVELSEARLRRLDGATDHKIVFVKNVTERKTLQHQLMHAQKMESVGRLAGGIAHDFNNVLAIMRGQVELLQDDLAVIERARARIDSVQRATDRAAALTDDLMAFSRRRLDVPEAFDLHELVLALRELLHQLLGPTVSLELRLDATAPMMLADPNRIEQAILNLAVNARDAMPSGGRLTLATRNGAAPASTLVLAITDTGVGMDAATRARVFEPFFTTKPPGLGTGLGMSTTAEIVKAAGATIGVQSEPGRGTTFVLSFPALEPEAPDIDLVADADVVRAIPEGARTVLVVDDEPEMRTLVAEILRGSGYRVVAAADGAAALALIEREGDAVDVLVTDVVMPVMSGTDLAERVAERSPGTRVLFVSGYVPAGSAALRGAPLVTKPLHRTELLDAVRALVEG